jgi:hypothetical protein
MPTPQAALTVSAKNCLRLVDEESRWEAPFVIDLYLDHSQIFSQAFLSLV